METIRKTPFNRAENDKARGKLTRKKAAAFARIFEILEKHVDILKPVLSTNERNDMKEFAVLLNLKPKDLTVKKSEAKTNDA